MVRILREAGSVSPALLYVTESVKQLRKREKKLVGYRKNIIYVL